MRELLETIYRGTFSEFCAIAGNAVLNEKKMFIVTANPEILMQSHKSDKIRALLSYPDTVMTADGISVVKAMGSLGIKCGGRITGVDLCEPLIKTAAENGKSIVLLGSRPEVISALSNKLVTQYPKIILNAYDGYTPDKDELFDEIHRLSPDLILVGLGVPAQELLIAKHLHRFSKGVFMGVGGSFDVLSGTKKRAPGIFIKSGTEWLYRICTEPSRLGRFYNNNVRFIRYIKQTRRKDF